MKKILCLLFVSLVQSSAKSNASSEIDFNLIENATECNFVEDLEIGLYQEQNLAEEIEEKVKAIGGNTAVYEKSNTTQMLWHGTDGSSGVDIILHVKAYSCE